MVRTILRSVILLCLVISMFDAGPRQCFAEPLQLRMNSQFTASATGSKIDQWFADEVSKATDGEVKIKIFWSGVLGDPKENLTLLRSGSIDMAGMSSAYFPSELPFFSAPNSLPMTMVNLKQSSSLMPKLMSEVPEFREEAARQNIRPLFFHLLNPYLLVSKTPITSLEDLKGKKVRTWGDDLPKLFSAAGAVPVTILIHELYESLEHGVVDATPFSIDMVKTYKLYEVAKHISEVVIWMGPAWGVWINEEVWNRISPPNKEKILAVAEKAREKDLDETAEAAAAARPFLVENGVQFHAFPAEQLAKWKAAAPDFYADWISRMAETGKGNEAKRTVDIMKRIHEEYK